MNQSASADLQATFDRERGQARNQASQARSGEPSVLRTMTVRMHGRLAAIQNEVVAGNKVEIACERGCNYCCHLRVEIRPHDAFVLAHHIQTRMDVAAQARIASRLDENLQRIARLTPEQHLRAGIPCAVLEEGVCSAYEGRPATCRKYYSVSVQTCRDAFNDPYAPLTGRLEDETLSRAGNAVALGYTKGMEEAGLDAGMYELQYALQRALESNKAEKRYRAGKKAFV